MSDRDRLAKRIALLKEEQDFYLDRGACGRRDDPGPDGYTRLSERQQAMREGFAMGANWYRKESESSVAGLVEALEKIASGDFPATGWNIFVAEQIARAALSSYRAKTNKGDL